MALSTRYSWAYFTPPEGGVRITLTCEQEDLRVDENGKRLNARSPKAGAKTFFPAESSVMPLPHNGIQSLELHMQSLTDDQCDSFFPQERAKKKKKIE
jgi:hypothetical protein